MPIMLINIYRLLIPLIICTAYFLVAGNSAMAAVCEGFYTVSSTGGPGGTAASTERTSGISGTQAECATESSGGGGGGGGGRGGSGGTGGNGAGGGVVLSASGTTTISGTIDARGGGSSTTNGGTVKVFYSGGEPSTSGVSAGRIYTASTGSSPSVPTLIAPADSATGLSLTPQFQLRSSDADNDYLQYKILIYNSDCSTGLQTFDQTISQTGWSGQDANGGTAYVGSSTLTSSTIATFAGATLSPNTTYCWKAAAIDPGGINIYSTYSATQTFTTESNDPPTAPSLIYPENGATNVRGFPIFKLRSTDIDSDYMQYKIEICSDSLCNSLITTIDQSANQTGWANQDAANNTAYIGSSTLSSSTVGVHTLQIGILSANTQYWWRAYAKDPGGTNNFSSASAINGFTIAPVVNINVRGGTSIIGGGAIR